MKPKQRPEHFATGSLFDWWLESAEVGDYIADSNWFNNPNTISYTLVKISKYKDFAKFEFEHKGKPFIISKTDKGLLNYQRLKKFFAFALVIQTPDCLNPQGGVLWQKCQGGPCELKKEHPCLWPNNNVPI